MLNNFFFLIGEMITSSFVTTVSYYVWKRRPQYKSLGYRSRRAESSEQAWDFAQVTFGKLATTVFGVYTALTLIVGAIVLSMNFEKKIGLAIFIAHIFVLVMLFFTVIRVVEKSWQRLSTITGYKKGGEL